MVKEEGGGEIYVNQMWSCWFSGGIMVLDIGVV